MVKNDEWKFIYWDEPIDDKENPDEVENKTTSKPQNKKDDDK